MPEGDTMHLAARRLREALAHRRVVRVEIRRDPRGVRPPAPGTTVTGVDARGKHLLITLIVERNREEKLRSEEMRRIIIQKCQNSLAGMTKGLPALKERPFDIGHLSIGCALAYADFRFHELNWRKNQPYLAAWYDTVAARPSFSATAFVDEDSGPKN